jgi:hypothetical protein
MQQIGLLAFGAKWTEESDVFTSAGRNSKEAIAPAGVCRALHTGVLPQRHIVF